MTNLAIIDTKNQLAEKKNREAELFKLIKDTYAKGATDEEATFFAQVCNVQNLDPIKRQIYFTKIWDSKANREVFAPIVSIDGMRSLAEETGLYAGQTTPLFCGRDGVWKEIWTEKEPPFAAKVGIYRKDFKEPVYAIAQFDAYAKKTKNGELTKFWKEMGYHMLAKAAEALALRKALPQRLSGLYSEEERHKDTIDVDFHKDEKPAQKPIHQIQSENANKAKQEFSILEDFNSKSAQIDELIFKLCDNNLGRMLVDEDFKTTFKDEFFQYYKDEYIKQNGKVALNDLFNVKLTAKRLTIIAYKYNVGLDEPLDDKQLNDLKKKAYNAYMKDTTQDLVTVFIDEAHNYIKF